MNADDTAVIADIDLRIAEKMKDPKYRNAYFRESAKDSIALQLRALRKLREMSQTELAAACQMQQSSLSRIEQSDYTSWTLNTLCRVAEALNARVIVRFQTVEDAEMESGK